MNCLALARFCSASHSLHSSGLESAVGTGSCCEESAPTAKRSLARVASCRSCYAGFQVAAHRSYGLPRGQDRLVPIFLATLAIRQQTSRVTFDSAAEMLDAFGLQQGGFQYRRLIGAFQRIFGGTIFFGT